MPHSDGTVSITVNGEHKRVSAGLSIAGLASEMGLVPEKVAVERNMEEMPRATLADVIVEDGDDFDIVPFVGGGDHPVVGGVGQGFRPIDGREPAARTLVILEQHRAARSSGPRS